MRKLFIILCLTVLLSSYILFKKINYTAAGEFEHSALSLQNCEFISLPNNTAAKDTAVSYYDGKKAKKCIKDTYRHIYPFVNQKTVEKSGEIYLLGYNDNTFAISDGLGKLKEKSFALYGYCDNLTIGACKEKAESFLSENNIKYNNLKKTYHFMGIYYFSYENPDGEFITIGVDTEFCEIKYLNQ